MRGHAPQQAACPVGESNTGNQAASTMPVVETGLPSHPLLCSQHLYIFIIRMWSVVVYPQPFPKATCPECAYSEPTSIPLLSHVGHRIERQKGETRTGLRA